MPKRSLRVQANSTFREFGRFLKLVKQLGDWAQTHHQAITAARDRYDRPGRP